MLELIIILLLLVVNGVFSMAEIALVSAKKARLKQRADAGDSGAALALKLSADPEQFLSTVQVGITMVGVVAGAFGGASLSAYVSPWLQAVPFLAPYAEKLAFVLVVGFITYLSLIIGELVPKSLALRNPEAIACRMAKPMAGLTRMTYPVVWLLGVSTRLLMLLFGKAPEICGPTPDEVQVLAREGIITGGVKKEESDLLESIFELREVLAEEIMIPKPMVTFLSVTEPKDQLIKKIENSRQTVFPVYESTRDEILGMVSLRSLYLQEAASNGQPHDLTSIVQEPIFVSENQPALSLLTQMRTQPLGAALVVDEFGTVRGFITLKDIIEEVVGETYRHKKSGHPCMRPHGAEGGWLADGMVEIDNVVEKFPGLAKAVRAEVEPFQTLAGFILHSLDRLPAEGDKFQAAGYEFEIVDMDKQRIDKVLIRALTAS